MKAGSPLPKMLFLLSLAVGENGYLFCGLQAPAVSQGPVRHFKDDASPLGLSPPPNPNSLWLASIPPPASHPLFKLSFCLCLCLLSVYSSAISSAVSLPFSISLMFYFCYGQVQASDYVQPTSPSVLANRCLCLLCLWYLS